MGRILGIMKRLLSFSGPVQFLLLASLSFGMLFANACEQTVAAQQRGPSQRVVQGRVQTKAGAALPGAVVYLKDSHTLAVKSFISDEKGGYRFGQLSQSTDYELWAEMDGKKSANRSISSLDSRNDFNIDLKIDTGK
jgi:hypothetical protein